MKRFLKFWLPAYLYAGLIFYLSSIQKLPEVPIANIDRAVHILEYGIFGVLLARAFKNSDNRWAARNFKALAIAIGILYGASDEYHQSFVIGRNADIIDLIFDSAGVLIGAIMFKRITYAKDNTVPGRPV